MVHMPDDYPRLPQRRPSLRSVPSTERQVAPPAPAALRPLAPVPEEGLLETLRKLWRRRWLVASWTLVMGLVAAVVAWSLPSYFVSEARVLVGVQAPRVMTAEAIITDTNPDAERVQNEGFILQSRTLAKMVIDKLRLADNPEFNPELRKPSFWSQVFRLDQFVPASVAEWFNKLTARPAKVQPAPVVDASLRDNRMSDILLTQVDVSLLGRSHVLSVKAESRNGTTAAAIANTLADTYLDYQRKEKIATLDRVDKFLLGRISELREQVRKSDQAVEDYRRNHGLYKSTNSSGVTTQQLTELNTQLIQAQTAKAEAESRLAEAQEVRKGGLGSESVPEVLRSPLISSLKEQQAEADRKLAQMQAMYGERHPQMLNARAEASNIRGKVGAEIAKT